MSNTNSENTIDAEQALIKFGSDAITSILDAQNVGYNATALPWVGEDRAVAEIIQAAQNLLQEEEGELEPTPAAAIYIYQRYERSLNRSQLIPYGRDYLLIVSLAILNAIRHRITPAEAEAFTSGAWENQKINTNEFWFDVIDLVDPVLVISPENGLKLLRADLAEWL